MKIAPLVKGRRVFQTLPFTGTVAARSFWSVEAAYIVSATLWANSLKSSRWFLIMS